MNSFIICILSGSLFLLSFLLFLNPSRVNNKGNKWFGFFIFCIFMIINEDVFKILKIEINKNYYIEEFLSSITFIIAPTFYFSILYYINPQRKWKSKDFFYFSLAILYLLLIIFSIIISSMNLTIDIHNKTLVSISSIISIVILLLFSIQNIGASILSYKKLIFHQKNIKMFSSNIEGIDLNWLKYIIICVIILSFVWLQDMFFSVATENFSLINFILLICVLIISFHTFKQKEIYPFNSFQKEEIAQLIDVQITEENNKKKLISEEKLEEMKTHLLQTMSNQKPYLDSELSLIKLASELDISGHLLSYIINNGFNENFYQFINRFRIEEAKKLIINPKMNHLSLLGIGFEVGFNSKTVFNTTFKKTTGFTPSEYKKHNLSKN